MSASAHPFRRAAAMAAIAAAALPIAAPAAAQPAPPAAASGVRESTDPARAAAVEQAAQQLRGRPPQPPVGIVRTTTPDGYALLSGGVTQGDRVTMHAERQTYSLWVATVARPSGAYLADVDLRIVRRQPKSTVLERRLEGPWLMIALPAGSYEVSGTFHAGGATQPQTLTVRVEVPARGQRQAVLRFDSRATVDPEGDLPFRGNPFGPPAAGR